MDDHDMNRDFVLEALDRQRRGCSHFGDAGLILNWIDDEAVRRDECISHILMELEMPPDLMETLEPIALRSRGY